MISFIGVRYHDSLYQMPFLCQGKSQCSFCHYLYLVANDLLIRRVLKLLSEET